MHAELNFTAMWRQALGLETALFFAGLVTLIAFAPPAWELILLVLVLALVLAMGWIKYWHMESLLRVPRLLAVLLR